MATLPRSLCVILTLWMVWQSPSPPILPEAPAFGAWWGTPQSKIIAKLADNARRSGDLKSAEGFYRQGYAEASRRRDERAMVGYLGGIAACQLTRQDFPAALKTLLESKARAKAIHDRGALGAIAVNLSSLYSQVYDFEAALREADEGRAAVQTLKGRYFLPNLLLQSARLSAKMHPEEHKAVELFRRGIEAARREADRPADRQLEAIGLDLLGEALLDENRLDEAEKAIEEAVRVRQEFAPKDLGYSWRWMGAMQLARGKFLEAAADTEKAMESNPGTPQYLLENQRGRIRLASGDTAGGLKDLEEAVALATRWRFGGVPASPSLTATNEKLEVLVFRSFIEAAAHEAFETGSDAWARKAFEAVELNRAASLRESLELSDAWHRRVPPEYWVELVNLRTLESKMLGKNAQQKEEYDRLRLELSEMEAKAGLGFLVKNSESFLDQTSLIHFQHGLGRSEVLLSFHLGDRESYLWTVTRSSLRLRRLSARGELEALVVEWSDAVRAGRVEAVELGARLYQELFGQLEREAAEKPSWLLSLDGALFRAPLAALVTEQKGGKVSYLVSKHSLQTIPGALLLSRRSEAGTGGFLGVGDPIYNVADSRWTRPEQPRGLGGLFQRAEAAGPVGQFERLVGSGEELKASAASWGGHPTILFEGATARREAFLAQAAKAPQIIHLATHVLSVEDSGRIAFGLSPQGVSEFLSSTEIASLRVPGALVAMTGCDSGSGKVRPGAGLDGLTRAWQMAGAGAVMATSWPVRDSDGSIFARFYGYLRQHSAAEALRLSQADMLGSGTWRAEPSYWAAYQLTGSAR